MNFLTSCIRQHQVSISCLYQHLFYRYLQIVFYSMITADQSISIENPKTYYINSISLAQLYDDVEMNLIKKISAEVFRFTITDVDIIHQFGVWIFCEKSVFFSLQSPKLTS